MMKKPWHLWVVGIVGVLWGAMGCYDYLMTQTGNEEYLKQFSAEQIAFFESFPVWISALWAVAVWGGLAGAVLILLGRAIAAPVLFAAMISVLIVFAYNFMSDIRPPMSMVEMIFTFVIIGVAIFMWFYSRAMSKSGVLK